MCSYSVISDYFLRQYTLTSNTAIWPSWDPRESVTGSSNTMPGIYPWAIPPQIPTDVVPITTSNITFATWPPIANVVPQYNGPTKEQFEEFLKLLRQAKDYDDKTDQPNCELEEKKDLLKKLAKYLGVDEKSIP